ncbi:hypothetical protein [Ferrimonas futtsuensis]|uniref:hypothetical protein n=1 Tax=Ferrimonas futtsuensis TaxID=364764 RepID=UPI000A056C86|nr:hypothetical protein [Ferrimonas futtsuensis]
MGLKVLVSSIRVGEGVSSKSGVAKEYKFANVNYLVPAKDYVKGDHNIQAHGVEEKSVAMEHDLALLNRFRAEVPRMPAMVDLELSPDPENPSRNIVTGFQLVK